MGSDGFTAIDGDVAAKADEFALQGAVTVERPLVAIGVQEVRNRRKALELLAVAPPEMARIGAGAWCLELDVAGKELIRMDGEIGPA
jgi:hypothetical protein